MIFLVTFKVKIQKGNLTIDCTHNLMTFTCDNRNPYSCHLSKQFCYWQFIHWKKLKTKLTLSCYNWMCYVHNVMWKSFHSKVNQFPTLYNSNALTCMNNGTSNFYINMNHEPWKVKGLHTTNWLIMWNVVSIN